MDLFVEKIDNLYYLEDSVYEVIGNSAETVILCGQNTLLAVDKSTLAVKEMLGMDNLSIAVREYVIEGFLSINL